MIWDYYKTQYPSQARTIQANIQREKDDRVTSRDPQSEPVPAPEIPPSDHTLNDPEAERQRLETEQNEKEKKKRLQELAKRRKIRKVADTALTEYVTNVHQMQIHGFLKDVWTPRSDRFDLIISRLPSDHESEEV